MALPPTPSERGLGGAKQRADVNFSVLSCTQKNNLKEKKNI